MPRMSQGPKIKRVVKASQLRVAKVGVPRALQRSEHDEQRELFAWAEIAKGRWPELALMFAIPNFSGRLGKVPPVAAIRQAQKLKAEGRKPGVPDVLLPVARGGYHGLFVEMKRANGVPSDVSDEQREWLEVLGANGYRCAVAFGFQEGRAAILDYLNQPNQ